MTVFSAFFEKSTQRVLAVGITSVVLTALAVGCGGGGGSKPLPSGDANISVDFSQSLPQTKPMVGFLHAITQSDPVDDLIAPLGPKLWRAGTITSQIYPRVHGFHSDFVMVCSDYWGYNPGNRPDRNFPAYQAQVKGLAQKMAGDDLIYDIWNEPNTSLFWSGSQDAYLQTFKIAHDAIRSVQPDALISGPSDSFYDHGQIELFLNFCLAHNIRLDVLSWHENVEGSQIAEIEGHIQEARQDFVNNPRYASLGIKEIQINECGGPDIQYKPASTLAVLDRLERGGADSAAHACWNDPSGDSNCLNNTLDGLLTPGNLQPRAVWWADKAYSDGVGSRVLSTSDNSRFVVLASKATGGNASVPQIIIGMYQVQAGDLSAGSATVTLSHLSSIAALQGATVLRMTITTVPASDGAAVPSLPPSTTVDVPIQQDSATATVPISMEAVYVITLTRP